MGCILSLFILNPVIKYVFNSAKHDLHIKSPRLIRFQSLSSNHGFIYNLKS